MQYCFPTGPEGFLEDWSEEMLQGLWVVCANMGGFDLNKVHRFVSGNSVEFIQESFKNNRQATISALNVRKDSNVIVENLDCLVKQEIGMSDMDGRLMKLFRNNHPHPKQVNPFDMRFHDVTLERIRKPKLMRMDSGVSHCSIGDSCNYMVMDRSFVLRFIQTQSWQFMLGDSCRNRLEYDGLIPTLSREGYIMDCKGYGLDECTINEGLVKLNCQVDKNTGHGPMDYGSYLIMPESMELCGTWDRPGNRVKEFKSNYAWNGGLNIVRVPDSWMNGNAVIISNQDMAEAVEFFQWTPLLRIRIGDKVQYHWYAELRIKKPMSHILFKNIKMNNMGVIKKRVMWVTVQKGAVVVLPDKTYVAGENGADIIMVDGKPVMVIPDNHFSENDREIMMRMLNQFEDAQMDRIE